MNGSSYCRENTEESIQLKISVYHFGLKPYMVLLYYLSLQKVNVAKLLFTLPLFWSESTDCVHTSSCLQNIL